MRRPVPSPLWAADQGGRLPTGEVPAGLRLRRESQHHAATVHALASCEWIEKSQLLCLIGDSGTGKLHMLIALGTEAAMKGYPVRYTLPTKLVNELVEAADEKQLNKTIARYGRVGLLCTDELGYMACRNRQRGRPGREDSLGRTLCLPGLRNWRVSVSSAVRELLQ